jgi:4-amino-4-deoxy-L-arabinose transferase-like glycosyltransferase
MGGTAALAVAVFLVLQLPLLRDLGWRHADEHLYTDAAVRMVADGDLTAPRAADGTFRFHKPLLTYWAIAASFRAFGIGVAASRLPSLLAIALLAWLAWRTTLVWFDDRAVGVLAVVILLAHPETAQLAVRATPDALLVCFVAAALLGIGALVTAATPPPGAALLAWGGAGLAVATKGIPGLLCLGYGVFVLARAGRTRWLLRPAAIALGAALALAGTAPSLLRHGGTVVTGLQMDQLDARGIVDSPGTVLGGAAHEIGSITMAFMPWAVLLAFRGRAVGAALRRHAGIVRFTLGWTVILLVLSTLLEFRRPRYVAPALPLLAIACAGLLEATTRAPPAARWGRRLGDGVTPFVVLGFAWMVAGGVFRGVVRPGLSESAVPALAACLDTAGVDGTAVVAVGDEAAHLASDLRLVSGGRLDLAVVHRPRALAERTPSPAMLVAGHDVAPELARRGWRLHPCGREARFRWTVADTLELVRVRDRERLLSSRARAVSVATPPPLLLSDRSSAPAARGSGPRVP